MNHNSPHIAQRYLHFAVNILKGYNGGEPFHLFLKKYFKNNRKHGSRDRRAISSLCYKYFRLGNGVTKDLSVEERLELADRIIPDEPVTDEVQQTDNASSSFKPNDIFPFNDELSTEILSDSFNQSFLIQPLLFIRIRPGYEKHVPTKLKEANIFFQQISDTCIGLQNSTRLDELFRINKEIVIQDMSSQETALFMRHQKVIEIPNPKVWDACAASGGKSILMYDTFKNIQLTVSDTRRSILSNLKMRFGDGGINAQRIFTADLTRPVDSIADSSFDILLTDVPCSGSGTWARTPEQLLFFKKEKIQDYVSLQRQIVGNCIPKLKKGGLLLYITCSVFRKENEENVDFFCQNYPLKLLQKQYLKGYTKRADTLFGALFQLEKNM